METREHEEGPVSRALAWLVVALGPLIVPAWIAAAVLATVALPGLGNGGPLAGLEPGGARATAVEQRSAQRFDAPLVSRAMVVQRDPGGLAAAAQARALGRAGRVDDPSLQGLRGVLPVINLRGVVPGSRESGTTAVSYLFFTPDTSLETQDEIAHAFVERFVDRPDDAVVGVTGASPARVAQWTAISDALPWVTLATIALIALVVGLRYRALLAPLVALSAATIAYAVTVGLVGVIGERAGVSVPQEVEPIMVVLLLGIVTDYAIFYLAGTRRRLAEGRRGRDAARGAARVTTPIVFTAGVLVAAATAALMLGRSDFFRAFGPGLALTALVSMVVSLTYIPALLGLLGRATFWPRGPGDPDPVEEATDGRRFRLARVATARPVALVIALACVAVMALAATGLRDADLAFPLTSDLPADAEPARAAGAAARGFAPGIVAPTEVLVEGRDVGARTAALERLGELLARRHDVAGVLGPGGPARLLPEGVLVSHDGAAARYAVVLGVDPLGASGLEAVRGLRDDLPALLRQAGLQGARADVAGDSALGAEIVDTMLGDLLRVAGGALLATFLVLAAFLRSWKVPLALVGAGVLALMVSLGLTAVLFERELGYDGLSWYVPFTAAVLLIALGSDYNVFVTGRIWQQARGRPLRDAIALAAPRSAKALVVAGVTLALSFAALAIVPLRSFRELAFALAVGVLLETFVVRSLLVPALLALMRPRIGRRRGGEEVRPLGGGYANVHEPPSAGRATRVSAQGSQRQADGG